MMRDEQLLAFKIKALSNQIKRLMDRSRINDGNDNLTGVQFAIMGFVGSAGDKEVFQRDIEAEFNIRRSTATGILQLLEKNGYITRTEVDYDARLKRITLTDKAMAVEKRARANMLSMEERLLAGISEEELNLFYAVADKIIANAQ